MVSRNIYPHIWLAYLLFIGAVLKSESTTTGSTTDPPKTTSEAVTPTIPTTNATTDGKGKTNETNEVTTNESTSAVTTPAGTTTAVTTVTTKAAVTTAVTSDAVDISTTSTVEVPGETTKLEAEETTTAATLGAVEPTIASSGRTDKSTAVVTYRTTEPTKGNIVTQEPGKTTTGVTQETVKATTSVTQKTDKTAIGVTQETVKATTSVTQKTDKTTIGVTQETLKATTGLTKEADKSTTGATKETEKPATGGTEPTAGPKTTVTKPAAEVTTSGPAAVGSTTARKVVTTQTTTQTTTPTTTQPPDPATRPPAPANRIISLQFSIVYSAVTTPFFRFKRDTEDPNKEELEDNLSSLYMNKTNGFNDLSVDSMPSGTEAGAMARYTVNYESAILTEDCKKASGCMLEKEIRERVMHRIPEVGNLPNRAVNALETNTSMDRVLNENRELLGNPCLMNKHVCTTESQTYTCKFNPGTHNPYVCENVCMTMRRTHQNYCQSGTCYAEHTNADGYNGRAGCSCQSGRYYDNSSRGCKIGCAAFHFLSHNNACVSYWAILGPLIALLVIAALLVGALVYMSRKGQDKGGDFGYATSNGAFKNPTYQGTTFG